MAKEMDNKKAIKEFESYMKKEREKILKKYPGEEGERMIRDFFVKKMPKKKSTDKKIRVTKPRALAMKGGMMKKKTKYMAKGGMKKTKYMAKGGMKKKTKMMSRGGATRRR
jgi:hypothetical protein